jgi:PAS domain S-box-containing protein
MADALAAASDDVEVMSVAPSEVPPETPAAVVAGDLAVLDALPAAETALVGADADPAAGYEAGVDAVIPVDPVERPGPVVAWLERTAARTAEDARYRALFGETSDGIVVHDAATGDVVEANDRFRELLGLDPDDPVTVESFAVGEYDAARARELVREAATDGPRTVEWVNERPDGDRFTVEVALAPVTIAGRDRVVSTVIDVSDRHDRRERFERTLDRVDDAFFALDNEWRFTYLNEAGAAVINAAAETDLDAADLRGRRIWELIPEAVDTAFYEEYHAAMASQEPRRFDAHYPPLDAWFEVRAYPSPEGLSVYFSDVTDRVERRSELRRYEAVLETAEGMVFVVDDDRRFSLVTEPLAERLGYDRAEIVGQHVSAVLDDEAVAETGAIRDALRAAPGDRSQTFEVAVRAADGERVPLEVELTAFDYGDETGTVGVVTDRSALRDAQAELATERDRLTYLFENLPDPAVEYDVDSLSGEAVVRSANAAFCDLFGVDRDRALGAPLGDLIPAYDADDAPERVAGGSPGEVVRAEVDREGGDGERRQFLFRGVSFRADDRVRAFGIYTDVTDARRRERYLQVVTRVLRHNLRNDLNVLLSYADRLRDEAGPDGPAAETAEQIAAVVDDLAALSEDARDLAQVVERGRGRDRAVVDLVAVARAVAARFPGDVALDLPDSLPVLAGERVERALFEVVENAVEHAPATAPPPRVEAVRADGWLGLRVSDEGPGIPETERAVVAGEREITQTEHGSGLGLWLARWIAEEVGGRLSFEETDAGTSVVLWFPAAD